MVGEYIVPPLSSTNSDASDAAVNLDVNLVGGGRKIGRLIDIAELREPVLIHANAAQSRVDAQASRHALRDVDDRGTDTAVESHRYTPGARRRDVHGSHTGVDLERRDFQR